jgi:MFS family permease
MITVIMVFFFLLFCIQMVMVHLVNYATDLGINSLVAAGLVSIIGIISIPGRLVMGAASDRLGMHNVLVLVCCLVAISLVCLIFTRQVWAFYFFAVFFGFAYGGEVPQIPLFVGAIGGTKSLATLIGLTLFIGNIGGALGPLVAGKVYDLSTHYQWAFAIGAGAACISAILAVVLKVTRPKTSLTG